MQDGERLQKNREIPGRDRLLLEPRMELREFQHPKLVEEVECDRPEAFRVRHGRFGLGQLFLPLHQGLSRLSAERPHGHAAPGRSQRENIENRPLRASRARCSRIRTVLVLFFRNVDVNMYTRFCFLLLVVVLYVSLFMLFFNLEKSISNQFYCKFFLF